MRVFNLNSYDTVSYSLQTLDFTAFETVLHCVMCFVMRLLRIIYQKT